MRSITGPAAALVAVAALAAPSAHAQSRNTENTLALDEGAAPVSGSLERMDWLVGSWRGEGLGGRVEEVWAPPLGGTMMGSFKAVRDGGVMLYEFMLLVEEGGTLVMKLKHFNADFSGWEERTDFVSFPLVKLEEKAAYFGGLTYRLIGGELHTFVAVGHEGRTEEVALVLTRTSEPPMAETRDQQSEPASD